MTTEHTRNEGRALFGGAQRLARELLTETGDALRAFEQLAMTLVQEGTPAQLATALAAAALDAVLDDAAADGTPPGAAQRPETEHPAVAVAAQQLAAASEAARDDTDLAVAVVPAVLRWAASTLPAYGAHPAAAARARLTDLADEVERHYFTTAGPPHPVAAARARAATEQLPTVGRTGPGWTYDREEDDPA